jgi:hypothetical protein
VSTSDFVLNMNGSGDASVNPGQTAEYQNAISFTSLGSFPFSVVLGCSTTAPLSTCSTNPNSLMQGQSATVNVYTTGNSTLLPLGNDHRPSVRIFQNAPILLLLLLAILSLGVAGRARRGRLTASIPLILILLSLVFHSSCASNQNSGTPKGTYTVSVTGVSGSLTHTTVMTLTVK